MAKVSISFHGIEHAGDLAYAKNAVHSAGGNILEEEVNYDAESCEFYVEVTNQTPEEFKKKAKDLYWAN